jgi:ABC-type oligopeptide transport system ATPase subunit
VSTLQIDQISKLYRASGFGGGLMPALRQVSFDIPQGEVVTLIGESGSGKTTLGKIVLRLIPASSGRILFDGVDVAPFKGAQLRDYYRHVQGVFQDPFSSYNPIYKADRVFEMLRDYFPRMPQPAWDTKIESALHAVALNPGDVLNRYPHQLSGGQQQRLLIARALLLDVKLLVADEIISMLDASTRVDVLNLLVSLKRAGLAILFITHDLSLGNYISDRTVILRRGAIVEMGPTVKVFGNPQHSYTKMLLAAVPQLHKKWQKRTADMRVAAGNGAAGPSGAEPRGRAHRLAGTRLRHLSDPAVALESAPPLVEREKGHLVAEEEQ